MLNARSTKISPALIFDKPKLNLFLLRRGEHYFGTLSISDGRRQNCDICEILKSGLRLVFQCRDLAMIASQSHTINFQFKCIYTKYIFYPLTHIVSTLKSTNCLCAFWKIFNYFQSAQKGLVLMLAPPRLTRYQGPKTLN